MKILILNPILYSGDGNFIPKVNSIKDTIFYSMCLGFRNCGHQVTLIAAEDYKPVCEENYEFELIYFKTQLKHILPSALPLSIGLYSYIKNNSFNYDLIIASETFGFHTLFVAMLCPKKTLIWQELNVHQKKLHKLPSIFWHSIIVPLLFRKIRVVVGRSEKAKTFILQFFNQVAEKTVDHGINIDKFKLADHKEKQFISIAQFIYRKNVDGIINKFAEFVKIPHYENYKLLLAGRGPLEDELKNQVDKMGLNDKVKFLGFLNHEELTKYEAESKAFLVNTRQDLNMVSIPESIVSGTPVLTNTIPNLAQFIQLNKLGIVNDNWGKDELIELADNDEYAVNCLLFRVKLSNTRAAQTLIDIFKKYENTSNK